MEHFIWVYLEFIGRPTGQQLLIILFNQKVARAVGRFIRKKKKEKKKR